MNMHGLIKLGIAGAIFFPLLMLCADQKSDAQAKTIQQGASQILDEIRVKLNNQMPESQRTFVMSGLTTVGNLKHFTLRLVSESELSHYSYNIETKELRQEQKS